jgi:hypothetical protein
MYKHLRMIVIPGIFLTSCVGGASSPAERPAPSGPLALTTEAGTRFTGPAARIDLRIDQAGQSTAELILSVADAAGRTWALQAALPMESLDSLDLRAQLVRRPLRAGDATVQLAAPGAEAVVAAAGRLQARLQRGMIEGDIKGASTELAASFTGPFVVTCAAPIAGAPVPVAGGAVPLAIDEMFESAGCKPYASLGQRAR